MNRTNLILFLISNFLFSLICVKANKIDWNWWRTAVIYEIYPKSFKDDNNDGYGDFKGIISKLPHFVDAGITAFWITTIYSSPLDQPYIITDYKNILEIYGTLDDFDELIKAAHSLNLKVILDFIPNNSGDQHEWFLKSENRTSGYEDFYVWRDGKNSTTPPNNWLSVFRFSAWTYSEIRGQWYLHQLGAAYPDLNYRNPKVFEEMTNVILFWLDRGIDGIRIDLVSRMFEDKYFRDEPKSERDDLRPFQYNYLNHIYTIDQNETYETVYYWRELLDNYTKEHGGSARIMLLGSISEPPALKEYYTNGKREGAHFPLNYQINFNINNNSTASDIIQNITNWIDNIPDGDYVPNWMIGDHTRWRVATKMGENNVDGFNMLNLLLPGIAVTYYGEEIGMENGEVTFEQGRDRRGCSAGPNNFNSSSRDFERTPYQWDNTTNAGFNNGAEPWLPVSSKYLETNLADQKSTKKSHYNVYKKLISLRSEAAFKNGSLELAALSTYVTGFTRILNNNEGLVVLLNIFDSEITVDLTKSFFNLSDQLEVVVTSISSNKVEGDILRSNSITLSNYEALVLKLK